MYVWRLCALEKDPGSYKSFSDIILEHRHGFIHIALLLQETSHERVEVNSSLFVPITQNCPCLNNMLSCGTCLQAPKSDQRARPNEDEKRAEIVKVHFSKRAWNWFMTFMTMISGWTIKRNRWCCWCQLRQGWTLKKYWRYHILSLGTACFYMIPVATACSYYSWLTSHFREWGSLQTRMSTWNPRPIHEKPVLVRLVLRDALFRLLPTLKDTNDVSRYFNPFLFHPVPTLRPSPSTDPLFVVEGL